MKAAPPEAKPALAKIARGPQQRATTDLAVRKRATKNCQSKKPAMHAGTVGERHPLEALPYTSLHVQKIPG